MPSHKDCCFLGQICFPEIAEQTTTFASESRVSIDDAVPSNPRQSISSLEILEPNVINNTEQFFIDSLEKLEAPRSLKPYDHSCRYKCNDNITESTRKAIFEKFWSLKSKELQTSFISSCVDKQEPVQHTCSVKTKTSTIICLRGHRVCKQFFLSTLDISNKRFTNILHEKNKTIAKDSVEVISPTNKEDDKATNLVRLHIETFLPETNTDIKFMDRNLSIKKMYKLYEEKCKIENVKPVGEFLYWKIFNAEYNYIGHIIS